MGKKSQANWGQCVRDTSRVQSRKPAQVMQQKEERERDMISGERERENVNNTKPPRPGSPSRFSQYFRLAHPEPTWTPHKAPAAHPGPVSEQKLSQPMGRDPAHTLPGYLCPSPVTLPAPWASTTPSTHFSPARAKYSGQGQEQFGFSCSENIPSKNDDTEAAMAALREPGGVFPRTYLLPYKPMSRKGVWPPPLPHASHCSPMVGPTAPDAAPQRTNPHPRSRDGQDTGE